jgi:F-type H+-transporting ATPase subunit a
MIASGFTWFHLLPIVDEDRLLAPLGLSDSYIHVLAWFACFLVIGFALMGRRGLEAAKARQGVEKYMAGDKPSFLNIGEMLATTCRGVMSDLLPEKDVKLFFPLISGIFCYIFTCNIMGIFPGFLPPTDNVNTNFGMAIVSFLVFNYVGLTRDASGYIKHLMGPVIFLTPLLFPIEIISLLVRPIALYIRLTGNMFGDHMVFVIMSGLIPVVLPAALLGLATMVSAIQAFIFSILTTIYISLSLPHDDHEGAHH